MVVINQEYDGVKLGTEFFITLSLIGGKRMEILRRDTFVNVLE